MPITKASGDMYPDIDWCWSALTGGCLHQCSYCYAMKRLKQAGLEWANCPHWASENYKKANISCYDDMVEMDYIWKGFPKLPEGRIFVCHTIDLFADNVPAKWIEMILEHCWETTVAYGESELTEFIFQTKNPERYMEFDYIFKRFPNGRLTFGTTIETNRDMSDISKAKNAIVRAVYLHDFAYKIYKSFVTIEPIMNFDLPEMVSLIKQSGADLVWIGADSKNSKLPEPSKEKTLELITELQKITDVRLKKNLDRLLPQELRAGKTKPQ